MQFGNCGPELSPSHNIRFVGVLVTIILNQAPLQKHEFVDVCFKTLILNQKPSLKCGFYMCVDNINAE